MTPQYYLSEIAKPADIEVLVSQDDFELALKELKPSVSEAEMDAYRKVQQQFQQSEDCRGEAKVERQGKGEGQSLRKEATVVLA
jgi:peroxin-6